MTGRALRLLRQEWRLLCATRANLLILAAFGALLAYAVGMGVQRVNQARASQREAIAASTEGWAQARRAFIELSTGARQRETFSDPSRADLVVLGERNTIAMAPPPLAALSIGTAREGRDLIEFGLASRHSAPPASRENPSIRLDGPLDPAFLLAWLLPLVVLALAYDVLSRDREQQVSPVLAAQGTPLAAVVFARLAVCFIAVFAITGGIVLVGVGISADGDLIGALPDTLLWLAALAASIVVWLALAGVVNARARSSATAGVALIAVWVVSSVLVPALASHWLSRDAAAGERLESVLGRRALDSDLTERAREVTERYYAENPQRRPRREAYNEYERYFVENYYPRQIAVDRLFDPVAARVQARRERQAQRLRLASMASPSLALKVLTDDLAGYAPERRARFESAARRFQSAWRAFFDIKFSARIPLTIRDYDDAPRFSYHDEPAAERRARALHPATGLLLLAVLASLAAFVRLRHARP